MLKHLLFSLFIFLPLTGLCMKTHDAHIHYSQDVWDELAPEHAIELLDRNNIDRAIVFSRPPQGARKLYAEAPNRVIPFLQPYRTYRDRFTWHSDADMLQYIKDEIETGFYQGFGEFHLFRDNKDTPILRRMMQLVADHNLAVNAHTDGETMESLIGMQPDVIIIWAHCGMDHPVDDVRRMLRQYPNLYCEMSFRVGLTDSDRKLTAEWKTLLEQHPDRFMVGMDTYMPRYWALLPDAKEYAESWLNQLDAHAARLIAVGNIERLFPRH